MSNTANAYLAFDLGAESGRAVLGVLENDQLTCHEVHRFNHHAVHLPSGLHWDITGIFLHIQRGLRNAAAYAADHHLTLASLGIDTWGVDFALLGKSGEMLHLPHCYRDPRNPPAYDRALEKIGAERLYDRTGIQLMPINTLYQLLAMHLAEPDLLARAHTLLFMPDLLHYFLTGEKHVEASIASTSQMIDPRTGKWATDLLESLDLPAHFLNPTVPAGSSVGTLRADLADAANITTDLPVITPAAHDTASAVVAVPAKPDTQWAFLSSGTWSLMGAQIPEPNLSPAARDAAFTNEAGVGGTRFLKNIAGLWLVQECRRAFAAAGQDYDYPTLTQLAADAQPLRTLIDADHPPLLQPGHMPEKIAAFARDTQQPVPETPGQFVRCCLESLALKYREVFANLQSVLDTSFDILHIVGGGGNNTLLNQMTADAIECPVLVGPTEGTAIGNLLVQAIGLGHVTDLHHARRIVANSENLHSYTPGDAAPWQHAAGKLAALTP